MLVKYLQCYKCGKKFPKDMIIFSCDRCGSSLNFVYDYKFIRRHLFNDEFFTAPVKHWKYWAFYPIKDLKKVISFNEGGTQLIHSLKNKDYYFKFEGVNPTGSFKDRGSTVEITKAVELGIREIACASTGNMGASVAAYASRAGLKSSIYVPSFAPKNKVNQIKAYGSKYFKVNGTYDDALQKTINLSKKKGIYLTGDYPARLEGEKSVGFEIIDQFNWYVPDYIVLPIGNGTLLSAVYKGLVEFKMAGFIKKIPRLIGVQAKGCNPIVKAFANKKKFFDIIKKPKTIASAINCGNPVDGLEALDAIRNSKGKAVSVSDSEILKSRKELGKEGIYSEISGAVSLAGAKKLGLSGEVVCVITGNGLKTPEKI